MTTLPLRNSFVYKQLWGQRRRPARLNLLSYHQPGTSRGSAQGRVVVGARREARGEPAQGRVVVGARRDARVRYPKAGWWLHPRLRTPPPARG